MTIAQHAAITSAVCAGLYLAFRSPGMAIACFAAGVFIDLDHFLDYAVNFAPRFGLRHFFECFKDRVFNRVIVFLHAWEWVALAIAIACATWSGVAAGIAAGLLLHMALDQAFNRHNPCGYFISFRLANKFDARRFHGAAEYRRRLKLRRRLERGRPEARAAEAEPISEAGRSPRPQR